MSLKSNLTNDGFAVNMGKLNGWQRLWIVVAVIYLVVVCVITFFLIPKEREIRRSWASDIIDVVKTHDKSLQDQNTWEILDSYSDLSYEEIIKAIKKKHSTIDSTLDYIEIDKKYEDKLANLGWEQIKLASIGFLYWLVPVILAYVMGLALGWIYRGFREA